MSQKNLKYFVQKGTPVRYGVVPTKHDEWDNLFQNKISSNKYVFERTGSIVDADIVVFTGGVDVSPVLYGERAIPETTFRPIRDVNDLIAWHFSANAQLRLGVCRGAQFLNVMGGGTLWQDVGINHLKNHDIYRFIPEDPHDPDNQTIIDALQYRVTSTHHQMMRKGPKGVLMGVAMNEDTGSFSLCNLKKAEGTSLRLPEEVYDEEHLDAEIIWYPETRSLCIQGHPEYSQVSLDFANDVGKMIEEVLCAD